MTGTPVQYDAETLPERILTIREQKVILDADLARIYGVATKRLNEQVKRNRDRFPDDFAFQLTAEEARNLRPQPVDGEDDAGVTLRPQFATASTQRSRSQSATLKRGHNIKHLPYAFTEHGAVMAATVLNSPQAVEMSVFVVRAFIKMREQLLATTTLAKRLAEVEKLLLTHDSALRDLYQKIRPLLLPPPETERKAIGFGVKERRGVYRAQKKRGKS